jgi:hypothetical protein
LRKKEPIDLMEHFRAASDMSGGDFSISRELTILGVVYIVKFWGKGDGNIGANFRRIRPPVIETPAVKVIPGANPQGLN